MISIALWIIGVILLALGIARANPAYRRMTELDRLAENAKRYDAWRGGSHLTAADDETTGADVMRQMLRRQALLWAGVALAGGVAIIAGFVVR